MMTQQAAEKLAIEALGFLAASDELLPVFQGASGTSLDEMKRRADDAEFLTSVLDFLVLDDEWVVQFCDAFGHDYQAPMQALAALPGGAGQHWT